MEYSIGFPSLTKRCMEQMHKESILQKDSKNILKQNIKPNKMREKNKIKNKILEVIVWWTGGNWEVAIELNTKPGECKAKKKKKNPTDIINVSRDSKIGNISCT